MSVFHNIYKPQFDKTNEEIKNQIKDTFFSTWFTYYSAVISTFSWGNLPKNTLIWQPEQYLTYNGKFAYFEEGKNKFLYPCTPAGALLENGQYSEYVIIAHNGKQWRKNIEDIEICYCNCLRFPTLALINEYADNSNVALRAVQVALKRAAQPKIVTAEDESGIVKVSDAINNPYNMDKLALVTTSEGISDGQIGVNTLFDNRADDVLSLWDVHIRYRNLFYTTFGVDNVAIQKKERLTEAEGSANDEIMRYSLLDDMYLNRLDFVNRVKEHFGHEFKLEINRDPNTVYNLIRDNMQKVMDQQIAMTKGANVAIGNNGGVDDGNVQNTNE